MFIFPWFLIPETKGLSLERMDDLFGVIELVENIGKEMSTPTHKENVNEPRSRKSKEEAKEEKAVERDAIAKEMK